MQTGIQSPWLSMWTEPRTTIRNVVQTGSRYGHLRLATAVALQVVFCYTGTKSAFTLLLILFLSPLVGLLWFYAIALPIYFLGRALGGKSTLFGIKSACVWSSLPLALGSLFWFILAMMNSDPVLFKDVTGPSLFFTSLIALILCCWFFYLLVQSVRELEIFSFPRSVVCCISSLVISSFVLFLIIKLTI